METWSQDLCERVERLLSDQTDEVAVRVAQDIFDERGGDSHARPDPPELSPAIIGRVCTVLISLAKDADPGTQELLDLIGMKPGE